MAEKRTIFNEGTDPGDETVEDPVIEEGRKISELPPAPLDADGMATPELEDGEMAIAADVPPGEEGGKLTYKIKLSDVITNAKSEFEEYNVKNILAGTYIDDVTETPVDSGNWTINAEKQRMDPGTFVESLNEVKGDVTLTSTDESIVIEPEEVLNEETNELEYTGIIDLSLNTTTSSLYRAWVEVTLENIDNSTFDFEDEKLTKDNSVVSVNGVVLDGDQYNLSTGVVTILGVDEIPLKVGDVIGVISFVAETPNSLFQTPTYGLRTSDISIVGEDPAGTPQPKSVAANNLQSQQDVNWYLLRTIENLDIPDEFDPDGLVTEDQLEEAIEPLASREWVYDQSYITEQPLTDSIDKVVQDQLEVDQRQDNEIQLLETRVSQIESVSLDARYMFEGDGSLPRAGEFTILKGNEVAESWTEATGLAFNEEALEGKPEWEKVTVGDVIRLGGSTASGIAPTAGREADSFAEFKVTAIVGTSSFLVDLIRSASHPVPGVEYGVLLLSSFDPSGLATTEFVIDVSGQTLEASKQYTDNKLVDYIPKAGGDLTGKLAFKSGASIDAQTNNSMNGRSSLNIRVNADRPATIESGSSYKPVLQVLKYEDQGGDNGDRALSPFVLYANGNIDTHRILSHGQIKAEDGLMLAGGDGKQNVLAKTGFAGYLCYGEEANEDARRLAWGRETVWLYKKLTLQGNKIYNVADPDPADTTGVVTVNYLNEALGSVESNTDELDERYVSKEGDEINSYLKVHSTSSGTTSVPFGVYTAGNTSSPKFHVTGSGSVRAGNTASEAFMAYYDHDLVTLKKLKEELEKLREECLPLLWKYNPDVPANQLGNGEFNLGSNPDWDGTGDSYLYMAKLNPKGKKWYGKNDDSAYSHDLGWWGMITIQDYDPDIVFQAKAGKLHFNEGSNNYFKIHISYLKKNFGLNAGRHYNINLPGFLPQWKYTNTMYTDGNTFSAFDLPDEEKKE